MMVQAEHSTDSVRYQPLKCQTVRHLTVDEVATPATICCRHLSRLHEVMHGSHTNDAREDVSLSTPYDFYQPDRKRLGKFP
jgi:hypothetical protein